MSLLCFAIAGSLAATSYMFSGFVVNPPMNQTKKAESPMIGTPSDPHPKQANPRVPVACHRLANRTSLHANDFLKTLGASAFIFSLTNWSLLVIVGI